MKFDNNNRTYDSFSRKKKGSIKKKPDNNKKNILINVIHEEYFSDERKPEEIMNANLKDKNKEGQKDW